MLGSGPKKSESPLNAGFLPMALNSAAYQRADSLVKA